MSQSSDRLIARLNGAADNGSEGGLKLGAGVKKEWSVRLENLSADVEKDSVYEGYHIEEFTVKGRWTSHVRKDEYAAGVRIDKKWGDHKNPYGNFTIKAKVLDGGFNTNIRVDVDNYDDEGNRYAKEHAEGLIRSILNKLIFS